MRVALLLIVLALAGCKPAAKAAPAPPPAEIGTIVVEPHDAALTYQYAGRVTAYRLVEVRARVGGILLRRDFVEGARVKAGQELFQIDPAPYQAALQRSAAQLQQARANLDKANRDLGRATTLLRAQAGTQQASDDALSARAQAEAGVAAAVADLRTQALNLGYTTVTAPQGGVTSLDNVPEGSLVGTATDNSLLTTITQTDPVYVTFSWDDADLAGIRGMVASGRATAPEDRRFPASVTVGGADRHGVVDFTDSSIDQATGTVRGRALFGNADGGLVPGQFVRITLSGVTMHNAITVPQDSVGQDAAGSFVYVVREGHAARVPVSLDRPAGSNWIVGGLHPGDAVVTDGIVHVHEGAAVRVKQAA